jgi:prepilin-type N-terminal cleavage/methylation domain-containing protein
MMMKVLFQDQLRAGFTLIEIIVALAILTITMVIGFVALNPGGQLAASRNTQRTFHLQGIMNGIRQNMADTSGNTFTCAAGPIPATATKMATGGGNYDIAPCLVPVYIPVMPYDPTATGAHYISNTDYDSGYTVVRNATSGQITLTAPAAELKQSISITR